MHIFRRAMPLWRVLRSASVAVGVVGALPRLLVLLPLGTSGTRGSSRTRVLHAQGFSPRGAADRRTCESSRLEDGLHLDQLSLVILHVLDELADSVVGAVDLVVFGREGLEEEGGEGGAGDVLGGEAEDVSDLTARIELGLLSKLKRRVICLCL